MAYEVDVSGTEEATGDGNFPLVPEGDYFVRVIKCEQKQTPKGNDYYSLRMEILEGESKGQSIFDSVFLTTASYPRLRLILSRLDFEGLEDGPIKLYEEDFVGRIAHVTVEHKESQDGSKTYCNPAYSGYATLTDEERDLYRLPEADADLPY